MKAVRIFVGINLPEAIRQQVAGIQDVLRKHVRKGRFKRTENFHLTLKFLGEVPADQVTDVIAAVQRAVQEQCGFLIGLRALGCFGGKNPSRVVWLGVDGEQAALAALQQSIDAELAEAGFPPERRVYKGHITLAQDVYWQEGQLPDQIRTQASELFHVGAVELFASELSEGRRVYTSLHTFVFPCQVKDTE